MPPAPPSAQDRHSLSPDASAGSRVGPFVGLRPDFSLSGVLALNNVPRINSAGNPQHQVIEKGFYGPEGEIELVFGRGFPR